MKLQRNGSAGIVRKLILLAACGVLTTTTLRAQDARVSIPQGSITIREAFAEIEKQTGYIIGFKSNKFNVSKRVNLSLTQGTTKEILGQLLAGTGQTWEVNGNYIVVVPASQPRTTGPNPEPAPQPANQETVHGMAMPAVAQRVTLTPEPESVPAPRGGYESAWRLTETPRFAVKTNLLYDATASIALGAEIRTSRKTTIDLSGSYRSWDFSGESRFRYFLIQPEFRLWLCEAFNGHFFGLHAHYAKYNVGGLSNPPFSEYMNTHRVEGWLAGVGVSYGYHWILGNRWALEATVGAGWAYMSYDTFPCKECGKKIGSETKNYFGPTKAGINLIFIIK